MRRCGPVTSTASAAGRWQSAPACIPTPPGDGLRRFAARAGDIRADFAALAHRYDPQLPPIEARGSPAVDALEAIGVAAAAAVRFLGPAPLWDFVAGASGGRLLSNTSCPLPPRS